MQQCSSDPNNDCVSEVMILNLSLAGPECPGKVARGIGRQSSVLIDMKYDSIKDVARFLEICCMPLRLFAVFTILLLASCKGNSIEVKIEDLSIVDNTRCEVKVTAKNNTSEAVVKLRVGVHFADNAFMSRFLTFQNLGPGESSSITAKPRGSVSCRSSNITLETKQCVSNGKDCVEDVSLSK